MREDFYVPTMAWFGSCSHMRIDQRIRFLFRFVVRHIFLFYEMGKGERIRVC